MNITVEAASTADGIAEACCIREHVFGRQCYRRLPRLDQGDPTQVVTLIARQADNNQPIAALSVVETTGDASLHDALEMSFPEGARVARYTQLAVLKQYRGLGVPCSMVLEARRRFVIPNRFDYTWLLFDANAAKGSSFCKNLGFKSSARVFATEYGRSRVLVRQESARAACAASDDAFEGSFPSVVPRVMFEDEWVAH